MVLIFDKAIIKCYSFCIAYFKTTNSSEMLGRGSAHTLDLDSRSNAVPAAGD